MNTKTPLRLGIVGAGAVVREIYQHLYFRSPYAGLVQVCAVADPDAACRNWFGDLAGLPADRRFSDYRQMLAEVALDVVQVNTPDHLHAAPTVAALEAGREVILPKPLAATTRDAHLMIQTARRAGRFLGVDFHKRDDPRIKEAAARFRQGRYGTFQLAVFYMLDALYVVDPNHEPRFFATPDFAEKNTPVSFLTVHMADALMHVVNLLPVQVRAVGWSQKLPALRPVPVRGYDLVDTELGFARGGRAHLITGWAIPNSAHAPTVQSARLICTDGVVDLALDAPGLREIHQQGIFEVNPLFRNFESDGTVTGYGISHPGRLYQQALAWRRGHVSEAQRQAWLSPMALGFYATLVLEAAEKSLADGNTSPEGVTWGATVDLGHWLTEQLGAAEAAAYGLR